MKDTYIVSVRYIDKDDRLIESQVAVPGKEVRDTAIDVLYLAYTKARQQVADARRAELED